MSGSDVVNYLGDFWIRFAASTVILACSFVVASTILEHLHRDEKRACAKCNKPKRRLKLSPEQDLLCGDCRGPGPLTWVTFTVVLLGLSGWAAMTWLWVLPSVIVLWWFFLFGLYFWIRDWKASKFRPEREKESHGAWDSN